uniref:hypothetical protein n=1 Tax=Roseovarius indicus TaxID=540747 RepID=UPI003B51A006
MALYGLGSVFKGDDASPTLQSIMMMDMARSKNAKEQAERDRINSEINSIWNNPMTQGASTRGVPAKNSYGLDMGRSSMPKRNTTTVSGTTYDMGWKAGSDYASAISTVESGGRYDAIGPVTKNGNRAYGKYQVMDFNVGPWTEKHLGRRMTPREFLADPAAQDAVFNAEFGSYVDRYGNPQDAASVWFSGRPMAQAGNASDGYTTVPEYVAKFTGALGQPGQQARPAQSSDFSFETLSGQQFQGALLPFLQQQQAQNRQHPTQGVRVAQNGTDWRAIALNIRNSNLPPEEKQRQFQQLRLMMQIEKVQQSDPLTGKERYMNVDGVLYDITGEQPRAVTERIAEPSAAEAKIGRIQTAYGVDYQTATGIADGVLRVSRDPYTDAIQVTNLATNEVWTPSAQGEEQVTQPTQQETQTQPDLAFGDPYNGAEDVFGLEGMARGAANAVTDFVTGQEVFPEAAQATRDFELLREDITQDLQSAYGQRVPSWALQALRDLAPSPGGFQGAGSAQGQLRALGRRFQSELQAAEQSLRANNRGMSPEDEAKANAKISALRRSMEKINQALGGFEADGAENETSSGVKWRVVQ